MLRVINKPFMLNVIMRVSIMMSITGKPFILSVVLLNVIMRVSFMMSVTGKPFVLSVIMLNVVEPKLRP
jgi:hypothetical protein